VFYIWESTKKHKIKLMYKLSKFGCLGQKFGLVHMSGRVSRHRHRVSERDRSQFCMRRCRILKIWAFHKRYLESIYLYIYLSIIDYRNSPMLLSSASLPSLNYTDFGTKLLCRHDIFVGHIPKVMNLAPV